MKSYAIIIPLSGNVKLIEFESKYHFFEIQYDQLKDMISNLNKPFDWFDACKIILGTVTCVMFCDDTGLLYDEWRDNVNFIASTMYNDTIAGDVILLSDRLDGGSYTFTHDEIDVIHSWLDRYFSLNNFKWNC